jgi:hypothetical protein
MCRKRRATLCQFFNAAKILQHFFLAVVDRNPLAGQQALKVQLRQGAQLCRLPQRQPFVLEESESEFPYQLSFRQLGGFKNAVW